MRGTTCACCCQYSLSRSRLHVCISHQCHRSYRPRPVIFTCIKLLAKLLVRPTTHIAVQWPKNASQISCTIIPPVSIVPIDAQFPEHPLSESISEISYSAAAASSTPRQAQMPSVGVILVPAPLSVVLSSIVRIPMRKQAIITVIMTFLECSVG